MATSKEAFPAVNARRANDNATASAGLIRKNRELNQRRRAIILRSGGVVLFRIALDENEREHTKTGERDRDEETTGNEVIKCPHDPNLFV